MRPMGEICLQQNLQANDLRAVANLWGSYVAFGFITGLSYRKGYVPEFLDQLTG